MSIVNQMRDMLFPKPAYDFLEIRSRYRKEFPPVRKGEIVFLPYRINPGAQWFEYVLAYAMRLRGYGVTMCLGERATKFTDGYFCTQSRLRQRIPSIVRAYQFKHCFGLPECQIHNLLGKAIQTKLIEESVSVDLAHIPSYEKYRVAIGKQVMGSLSRYFLSCRVDLEQHEREVREFFLTALTSLEAAKNIAGKYNPKLLVSSHGIYSSWGSFGEYFRVHGRPYVTWGFQYRKNSFIVGTNKSYHRDVIEERQENWKDIEIRPEEEKELIDYIRSKGSGSYSDNINYYAKAVDSNKDVRSLLGFPENKPIFGLFPNLGWDAQVSFKPLFFSDMNEWIISTVKWFCEHDEKILVIRAHPAELRGSAESQDKVVDLVTRHFSKLPDNVYLLPPDSPISSYSLLGNIDMCLIYGSKFGLEAILQNIPLIVCGEAYFRGKGISYDPGSIEEYFKILGNAPESTPVTSDMYVAAIKYGYHFHFRRQVILPLAEMSGPRFERYLFNHIEDLEPTGTLELDTFIDCCLSA